MRGVEGLLPALKAWADDEWLFGQFLVYRVGFYGPDLEENIALASLAQDEMGHAMLVTELFLPDSKARENYFLGRPAYEFRTCGLLQVDLAEDWAAFALRNYVYEVSEHVRLEWYRGHVPQLKELTELMWREEAEHLDHWEHWVRLLAQDGGEGRTRLLDAAGLVGNLASDLFFLPDPPAGFDGAELRARLAGRVEAFLRQLGLEWETFRPLVERLGLAPQPRSQRPEFIRTVDTMQSVYRSDPEAVTWG